MKATKIQPAKLTCYDFPTSGPPTEKGCSNTLNMVPASSERQTFGPRGYPGVDVGVPQVWKEHDPSGTGCSIVLDTVDRAIIPFKWNSLWLLGTVINAVCVRQGKGGIYYWNGKRSI